MACLLDTGVLLRAFDADFAEYRKVREALRKLLVRRERMVVALQNLAEFWNASPRPAKDNGYGLAVDRVIRRMRWIEQLCEVVTEDDASFRAWKNLLTTHSVTGIYFQYSGRPGFVSIRISRIVCRSMAESPAKSLL